jgi:Methyltransferase FkbM domain
MHRVDYMTIDTEGSEVDIVEDFPWNEFDIRVVQVEQLSPQAYPGQREKKNRLIVHMRKFGYKLLGAYTVSENDTEDMVS